MSRHVADPTGLTGPLALRGSDAPAAAHRALGRATNPAMLAGQPGPIASVGTRSLDSLIPIRIGDAALRLSLSRLHNEDTGNPVSSPQSVAVLRPPAAPTPSRRLGFERTTQVASAALSPQDAASQPDPPPPQAAGLDGSPGSTQGCLQRTAVHNSAAASKISLTGRGISRMRIIEMARLDGGPRSRSPEPSAQNARSAASPTATGGPPSSRQAPSFPARSADATATAGSPSTVPSPDGNTPGTPAGNGLGDLVDLWERRSTADAEQPENGLRHGREETDQYPHPATFAPEDEVPAGENRTAERATTFGRHTAGDHAAADAPELGDEALLLEMLERALRSEARRHGIQLDTGGLW